MLLEHKAKVAALLQSYRSISYNFLVADYQCTSHTKMQVTLRLRYSVHVADCLLHYSTSHASNSAFVDNITFLQH